MKLEHVGLASALAAGAAAQHDDGRHFINWDMIEHPVVESFKWVRPFPDDHESPMGFESTCNTLHQFHAKQFKFREFHGTELRPWGDLLTDFYSRKPYPGHWDGVNEGGDNRDLMMMDWKDVPKAVQKWIEDQMLAGKAEDNRWSYLIAAKHPAKGEDKITQTVGLAPEPTTSPGENMDGQKRELIPKLKDKDKVLFFVAGQIYDILPLWVAKHSKCESQLLDLKSYVPMAKDKCVVAWVTFHSKPDKHHDVRWKIRAEAVEETDDQRHHRTFWEKIHLHSKRGARRQEREERLRRGESLKDEL